MPLFRTSTAATSRGTASCIALLLALAVGFVAAGPTTSHHDVATASSADLPSFESLEDLTRAGQLKRLDKGIFELFQVHTSDAVGWVYVKNSTLDGDGTEYRIYTSDFDAPTQQNSNEEIEFEFVPNTNHQNLTAALNWIVQTYSHVQSTNDLTVDKHVVTPIQ